MTPPRVRPLRPHEATPAARLAARAFADDPLFAHLYPDAASRQRRFATEHAAYIRRIYLPVGISLVASYSPPEASGGFSAIALWLPPESFPRLGPLERACIPALRHAVGLPGLSRTLRAYAAFDRAFPADRWFYYLGLLATAPEAQGHGLGSALVRAVTDRADREGAGCYLETGTESNLAFYARHGFRVDREIPLPDGGPLHWGLWRDPA